MLNKIALMGRLTRDPELRHTQSGNSVASFTLACDKRDGQNASAAAPASSEFKPLPSTTPVPFSAPDMPQIELGDDDLPF